VAETGRPGRTSGGASGALLALLSILASGGCTRTLLIGEPDAGGDSGANLCLPQPTCTPDQVGSYGDPCARCGLQCTQVDGGADCQLPGQLVSCQLDAGCFMLDAGGFEDGGGLQCVQNLAADPGAGLCVFRCQTSANCPSVGTICRSFPDNPASGLVCYSNSCDLMDAGPYLPCDASAAGANDGQCLPYDTATGFGAAGACVQTGTVPLYGLCRLDRIGGLGALCAFGSYCVPGSDGGGLAGVCLPLADTDCGAFPSDGGVPANTRLTFIPTAAWALCVDYCPPDCAAPTLMCTPISDGGEPMLCLPR
jgi:hypothetical protein